MDDRGGRRVMNAAPGDLDRLASEGDPDRWAASPLDEGERTLGEIADWGPAEDLAGA